MSEGDVFMNDFSSVTLSQPWTKVCIDDKHFIFKWHSRESGYYVLASDFCNIWNETLNEKSLLEQNKALNASLEAPAEDLLSLLSKFFDDDAKNCRKILVHDSERLHVYFTSDLSGYSFIWKFCFSRVSHDILAKHLTFPLFAIIHEQQQRYTELCNLIKRKDEEIQDYVLAGASLMNKRLETKPFDESMFTQAMSVPKFIKSDEEKATEVLTNGKIKELYKYVGECIQHKHTTTIDDVEGDVDQSAADGKESATSSLTAAEKQLAEERERRLSLERHLQKKEERQSKKRKKHFKF